MINTVYILAIAVVQGLAELYLLKPYIKTKKDRRYADALLFLLLSGHDAFFSFMCMQTTFLIVELLLLCVSLWILFYFCYRGKTIWCLMYLFSMDFTLTLVGSIVSFPVLAALCRFDINRMETYMDEPSAMNFLGIVLSYVIAVRIVAGLWKFMYQHKGKRFTAFCIVFSVLSICVPFSYGWRIICFMFLILMLLIILLIRMQRMNEQKRAAEYEYYVKLSELLQKKEQQISEIRHDLATHLGVLEKMKKENDGWEILKQIDKREIFSGIPELDCLIWEKETECEAKKVLFQKQGVTFVNAGILEYDLVSLFANLLDNAIEAAQKTPKGEISLCVEKTGGYLKLTLINSKLKKEKPIKNKFKTTKADKKHHGIGSRIIREIVDTYDGRISYKDEDSRLRTIILLQMPKQLENAL